MNFGQARRLRSLEARLSLISLLLFALIVGFGLFTLHLFNGFNTLSDDLRTRWLPSTRSLGDLNNSTSDFRAAEGSYLLATPDERVASRASIDALSRQVAAALSDYRQIPHTAVEKALYASFAGRWAGYQAIATRAMGLAGAGETAEAATLYRGPSQRAYNAASDVLGALTAFNVEQARAASARTARAYHDGRALIFVAIAASFSLLAAALAYIRRSVSRPLGGLALAMRRLAANTTEIEVVGTGREDEIGEMARAVMVFRANAIELIQSQRGLAQQAAMLEQKLAYEQELTRLQRNFVSMISHEFRTPLTAIDAHAQRLVNKKDHIGPADLADRAVRIRSAVHRLTGLMDNLLSASRLMDGEAQLFFHPAALDFASLLHEVCAFHREIVPNAFIGEAFSQDDLMINGDAKLLFQAMSNLLSNAIKYSPGDVMVRIKAWREDEKIIVTVSDKGLGIPTRDQKSVFTRYYRGSNVSGIVGTGVGLYLARTVVQLHGGDISVQSEEGKGACFWVTLPA